MQKQFNTQPGLIAKKVLDDTAEIAMQSRIDDWYDTTTLARENLQYAESLFYAIDELLKAPGLNEDAVKSHLQQLARLGCTHTGTAADIFYHQATVMKEITGAEGVVE